MSQEQALKILSHCLAANSPALTDSRRFKALLKDSFKGQFQRERNLLLLALEKGIPAELQRGAGLPALAVAGASARLTREFGIEASLARWAAEAWAVALGLIVGLSKPQTAPPAPRSLARPFPQPIPISVLTGPKRPAEGFLHPLAMRPQSRKRPPGK